MGLNASGQPIEGRATRTTRNILRRVRRRASKLGCTLHRFSQNYGLESDLGPEWKAQSIRYPRLAVLVWKPIGDDNIEEARRTCSEVIETEYYKSGKPREVFGISWIGPWPGKNGKHEK